MNRARILRGTARVADLLDRGSAALRRALDRAARRADARGTGTGAANDAETWDRVYDIPVDTVTGVRSYQTRLLQEWTQDGDVVLEAGCGSAVVSAELAHAGRRIALADFSDGILTRAAALFARSGLDAPRLIRCDLTEPLPLADGEVDVVWSGGVLEHWTDEELHPIVSEMRRVARRRVIALVPYAGCVFYRLGKELAEREGTWPYGRELPRASLRAVFEQAGMRSVEERILPSDEALWFLRWLGGDAERTLRAWWRNLDENDPLRRTQGYMLAVRGESGG